MTLTEIKTTAAGYLGCTTSDFDTGTIDLALVAMNQSRRMAEMNYDFEFSKARFSLSVPTDTGASLEDLVLVEGGVAGCTPKTIIDVSQMDQNLNLRPVEWTTETESFQRQRQDNRRSILRYPTDGEILSYPAGRSRVLFQKNLVNIWPKPSTAETFTLYIDAYTFYPDWATLLGAVTGSGADVGNSVLNGEWTQVGTHNSRPLYVRVSGSNSAFLFYNTDGSDRWMTAGPADFPDAGPAGYEFVTAATTPAGTYTPYGTATGSYTVTDGVEENEWLIQGEQYMLWNTIIHLNHKLKEFVPRTEGNLSPPAELAASGLQALKDWDTFQYEQFRRHGR